LFRSGSADVDTRGKQALALLAEVLTKQPEIDIFIEGHTDNVPIRTARFTDNWDLSVLRATSVVRILTVEYKVNSTQIIPSGRSQYFPVDDNSTTDGRAKNRRTEIILSPKLDKLFEMLNEHQAL
jgi:chemotaxis protein MotB